LLTTHHQSLSTRFAVCQSFHIPKTVQVHPFPHFRKTIIFLSVLPSKIKIN
jgi:hypothetical protein